MSTFSTAERIDVAPQVGTEFRGLQLAKLDGSEVEEVKQLGAERCVVFFRDQHMTLDEQVGTGRRLGELHSHPNARPRAAEAPRCTPRSWWSGVTSVTSLMHQAP